MSTIQNIFFKPSRGYRKYNYNTDGAAISVEDTLYQLDGVISEQHTGSVKVTKHPVEYGVSITDHIIKQPLKLVVNGIVTNSPRVSQLLNHLPGSPSLLEQSYSVLKGDRASKAYEGLIELQNELEILQIQTGLMTYDNMVLTSVSAPNDIQNNLRVKLTFEEVFILGGTSSGKITAATSTPSAANILSALATIAVLGLAVASTA